MTHICVGKLTTIASDNGLSPGRRQAIIWTNDGLLLIGPLGTNFSEILIEILTFSFKKMRLKEWSGKRRPFCLGLNVFNPSIYLLLLLSRLTNDNLMGNWQTWLFYQYFTCYHLNMATCDLTQFDSIWKIIYFNNSDVPRLQIDLKYVWNGKIITTIKKDKEKKYDNLHYNSYLFFAPCLWLRQNVHKKAPGTDNWQTTTKTLWTLPEGAFKEQLS